MQSQSQQICIFHMRSKLWWMWLSFGFGFVRGSVWQWAQAPLCSCALLSSCLSPLLPSPTCRGMRPSRGVHRGCLPGLDFVSLSADVFLCLRSRSPRPRSPRQLPRPRPRHCSQRHWPAVMLSGKLSLARLTMACGAKTPGLLCLHTDRQLHPPFL